MATRTTNYNLYLPTVGSDDDQWGSYINTNTTTIDTKLKELNDAIADQDLEELGNVVNTTPATDQVLQFNGQNWSASTLAIADISGLQTALDNKADDSDLTGITTNPADGSVSYAKLNTALQVQVDRILLTDDDATPTDNQILKYSATDAEWKYADLPGSTVQTLSDVNTAALADDAVMVYNSTAGEFQFESGSTLRTTLGVDASGTDNSTPVTLSGSLDYLTLSGQAITLQQINLTTDVTDTLPVASGGTGSATASDARTALGLGTLATQNTITESQISDLQSYITASSTDTLTNKSGNISQFTNDSGYLTAESNDLTSAVTWANVPDSNITQSSVTQHQAALSITESQISDLQTYLTAASTATLTNKSGNISQWINDSGYLTAETNNLSTVTGTLGTANGGTGLTAIGTANQVLAVNSGATALEFQTLSLTEVNDLTASVTWANVPDSNITQSSVTQHQAALSITESQISDLQNYLTAETNDLGSTVTGTLGTANGGTGLTSIGTAGQVLTVNAGATALEYQTPSSGGGITAGKAIALAMIFG